MTGKLRPVSESSLAQCAQAAADWAVNYLGWVLLLLTGLNFPVTESQPLGRSPPLQPAPSQPHYEAASAKAEQGGPRLRGWGPIQQLSDTCSLRLGCARLVSAAQTHLPVPWWLGGGEGGRGPPLGPGQSPTPCLAIRGGGNGLLCRS